MVYSCKVAHLLKTSVCLTLLKYFTELQDCSPGHNCPRAYWHMLLAYDMKKIKLGLFLTDIAMAMSHHFSGNS